MSSESDHGSSNYSLQLWAIIVGILGLFILNYWSFIVIVVKTFPRDIVGITRFIRAYITLFLIQISGKSVGDLFDIVVKNQPEKVCFQTDQERWTFLEVLERANQIGNYFRIQGYKKGDSVALFMENRPEYVCIWLGLSKIGVLTCLINTNLRLQALKHSVETANCKALIYGQELSEAVSELYEKELETGDHVHLFSVNLSKPKLDEKTVESKNLKLLEKQSKNLHEEIDKSKPPKITPTIFSKKDKPTFSDELFCIYTSGTTGLPKAAIVKHSRFIASISISIVSDLRSDDVFYTCLPLYHSLAGLAGAAQALLIGSTVVIRNKFSARAFWKDCVEHEVTVVQSIGELCRYLLNHPVTPEERQHKVRLFFSSGMKSEIWTPFVERFNIPNITEIYGSTEGNCGLMNFDNRVGAVGFIPVFLRNFFPVGVFKVDEETGELVRDPLTGKAIRCKPNEPGEVIGKISKSSVYREFNGYAKNGEATKKKIVRDVFSKGDKGFRTGDYLVTDEFGYYYFKDRTGDTFRWKGENVSTAEVEDIISKLCDLKKCAVYGVEIPGTNGRAGMAAIEDPENSTDFDLLAKGISKALPSYSRPLFVRITKELETTGTHKLKKLELRKQGFNLTEVKEPIYFFNNGKYVLLEEQLYEQIMEGKMKL